MLLRRVPTLVILMLSLGSTIALADSYSSLSQTTAPTQIAQSTGDGLSSQLGLSADQTRRLQQIRNKYKDQIAQSQQSLRQREQELRNMMTGTASASQIRSKYQQVQSLRQQLGNLRFESQLAMREILTPDQRRKVTQLMESRQEKGISGKKKRLGSFKF